jgi:hypothetical protein
VVYDEILFDGVYSIPRGGRVYIKPFPVCLIDSKRSMRVHLFEDTENELHIMTKYDIAFFFDLASSFSWQINWLTSFELYECFFLNNLSLFFSEKYKIK